MQRRQSSSHGGPLLRDRFLLVKVLMAATAMVLLGRMFAGTGSARVDVNVNVEQRVGLGAPSEQGGSELVPAGSLRDDFSLLADEQGEEEKHQVIVLTWKRWSSLQRLLESLDAADYMGKRVKLVVQVDGGSGSDWKKSIKVARDFKWRYGSKEVRVLPKNGGLMNAWLTCWKPKSDDEIAVILEDDLTVSPHYFRYVTSMYEKYGDRKEVGAVTLQRQKLVATNARYNTLQQEAPFGYKLLGTWGMSPSARVWREFLKLDFKRMNPHVGGLITSKWFARQKRGKMWSQFFIWYCHKHRLYNIYLTAPNRRTFATNWREAGVHFGKSKGADFKVVTEWNSAWDVERLPDTLDLYSFGLKKEGRSIPQHATSDNDVVKSIDVEALPAPATRDEDSVTAIDVDVQVAAGDDDDEDQAESQEENSGQKQETESTAEEPEDDPEALSSDDISDFAGSGDDGGIEEEDLAAGRPGGKLSEIVRRGKEIQKDGIMFMQLLNEGFVEMTAAWACNVQHMPRVLDRTLFVCTDKAAFEKMTAFKESSGLPLHIHFEEHKAPKEMSYGHMDYYNFILYRASLLKALLGNGVSVFLVESDATWFSDPAGYLLDTVDPSYDVVAMHNDYKSPTNINGGFLWLKATAGTRSVVNRLYKGFKKRLDGLAKTGKNYVGRLGNEQQFFKSLLFSTKLNPNGLPAKTLMLPSDKFAGGLWFKKDYKSTSTDPLVVLNNWVRGNKVKKERAIEFGHWFLDKAGEQCVAKYQPVPTAADLAIEMNWPMIGLGEMAHNGRLVNSNIGETTFVMFARKDNADKILNWVCNVAPANKDVVLESTVIVCEDQATLDKLKKFQPGLKVFLAKVNSSQSRDLQRLSVIYALLRSGLSVLMVQPNTAGFTGRPTKYFAKVPAEADIAMLPSASSSALAAITEETIVLFKQTRRTVKAVGTFLVAAQKHRFNKIKTLPSQKRYLSKLNTAQLSEYVLPTADTYSAVEAEAPWTTFLDLTKANLQAAGLFHLSADKTRCDL